MSEQNQLTNPDDGQIYALNNREFDDVQSMLALMRHIRIMMWAYRFDHARYVLGLIRERYRELLRRGEEAIREQIEFFEDVTPFLEDNLREKKSKDLSIDEEKTLMKQFQSERISNPYIAVAGIATTTDFLANRLNMDEIATSPDNNHFEYGLLQLDDKRNRHLPTMLS